jgi:exopolyphosphatase/guanosine-5'-triphosphate,3'-diphosphate pyrophosphatase
VSGAPVAVIDLGTITTRLLILGDGVEQREMTITRMGEGVAATGRIGADAIGRVGGCLGRYRELIDAAGVQQVRAVATSAARDALNRSELFGAVEAAIGVEPELLSGDEEGRLAFAGAVAGVGDHDGMVLVIDIGGGSTEFAIGTTDGGLEQVFSADTGAARITDAFLLSDPPRPEELSSALSVVELHLADVKRELPAVADALGPSGRVVGLGGTITTMAAVELGLVTYDREQVHRFPLTRAAAEDVFRTLATESAEDRAHNPGLHPDRVPLIVGGACVLVETMRQFDIEEMIVSESDLLDGIAGELMAS